MMFQDRNTSAQLENSLGGGGSAGNSETILLPPVKCVEYTAIFEEALEQLSILQDITPEQLKTDNKQLSERIKQILNEQKDISERQIFLQQEIELVKGQSNKMKLRELQGQLQDSQSHLQSLTSTLARLLKHHPSVAQNLLKIQQERTGLSNLIQKCIKELKEGQFTQLITTVEDSYKKLNILQTTINREGDASEMLREIQRELQTEKKLITDEMQDRNTVIQQLKDTIQEIHILTASEQKYIKKEVKAHEACTKQHCAHKLTLSQGSIDLMRKTIAEEKKRHDAIMSYLQGERDNLELQIQGWMTMYEDDLEAKTVELEQLKVKRSQDLDTFEELVTAYEALERIVDDDKKMKAIEREAAAAFTLKNSAASKIQRIVRRWLARKRQAAAEKKEASGSAKGKKGKKGKK